jgi:CheY-like chemotaxis protein
MQSQPDSPAIQSVLIVEDNDDNVAIYTAILRHHGFEVFDAPDGAAGVVAARLRRPSVILMDVALPVMDGWEATRRLKADPETAMIPVVALTAHALEEHRQISLDAGCDEYIPKPAEPRTVLDAVRRLLSAA